MFRREARAWFERAGGWLARRRFALLVAFTFFYFHQGSDPNQTSRLALTRAVVERHAVDITPDHALTLDKGRWRGRMYSDKAPAVALALVPVYALMNGVDRVLGQTHEDRGVQRARLHVLAFVAAGLPGVIATCLVLETLLLFGVSRWLAHLLAVGYALGTIVFPFSTVIFGHVLAAALLLGPFYLLQKWRVARERIDLRRALSLGALWGGAIVTEYPTGLLVAIMGLYALSFDLTLRGVARVAVGAGLGAAPLFAGHVLFAAIAYGEPLSLPYKYLVEPIFIGAVSAGVLGIGVPTKIGLWGVFLSPYRGLFFLSPFLALLFAGFAEWWRRGVARKELATCVAMLLVYSVFASSYYAWDGGGSTGSRHLVPVLAFAVLPIGFFASGSRSAAWVTALLVAVSVVILYLTTAVIVQAPEANPYEGNPFYKSVIPSLLRGELDHNLQDAYYARSRADVAYNLGTLFGLPALVSLLVPPLVWALAYCRDLLAQGRQRAVV